MSEYTPITGELRELLADINWTEILDHVHTNGGGICDGDWLDHWHEQVEHVCDAIDSIHAQLERENASLKAELDRVLGEQEKHQHSIGEVTVTITPTLDWSAVALELHSLACHLAGEAE